MTKRVQRRRGTTAQHASFTGVEGELTVNTTNKSVHVHDGVTAGGIQMARADLTNVSDANLNTALSGNTLASLVITSADINGGTIDGTVIGGAVPSSAAFTTISTTGVTYANQPAQTSNAAAATLTIAKLLTGIIQYTGAVATLTLPTGTLIEGGVLASLPINMAFDFVVINTGTGIATIATATGLTLVGTMTVAIGASAGFRVRKTATNTYTVYRTH